MGFFKKIFKGVKKVFKKIGRGIKKVVGKVGKFMNKIPLVGQVALAFVGGPILSSIFKGIGGIATTALGKMGTFGAKILQGAQYISSKATAFASAVNSSGIGRAFKTITDGVSSFFGEMTKTAASKLGFDVQGAAPTFSEAWGRVQDNITNSNASALTEDWTKNYIEEITGVKAPPPKSLLGSIADTKIGSFVKDTVVETGKNLARDAITTAITGGEEDPAYMGSPVFAGQVSVNPAYNNNFFSDFQVPTPSTDQSLIYNPSNSLGYHMAMRQNLAGLS
tara:strand:- start:8019 stop:8855 length:837 start_codon:yes stop_codon:yes gene_type:complete